MLSTALALAKHLQNRNDIILALQAGIAGSFKTKHRVGTVVSVSSEEYGDTGIETFNSFKTLKEAGFEKQKRYRNPLVIPVFDHLPSVSSLTVSTACGTAETAAFRYKKFKTEIENMEGLAFFRTCRMYKIPYAELRSISNYCGPHSEGEWNMPLAIKNLTSEVVPFVKWLETETNEI
jgi:futalosine hydrolase